MNQLATPAPVVRWSQRPRVALTLGAATIAAGLVAGRFGVHFTGMCSTSSDSSEPTVGFARSLLENLLAWPLPALLWWGLLRPFGPARLMPLLFADAAIHALSIFLGFYGFYVIARYEPPSALYRIVELGAIAVAVALMFVAAYVGVRRSVQRAGWRLAVLAVATFVVGELGLELAIQTVTRALT